MTYKTLLPERIPEHLQGDNNLKQFLEVAGELFDAYSDAIDSVQDSKDYANVPEKRLRDLAAEFAIQFPRNLNKELQRTIIRDLEAIYQKSGSIELINWIFRLIGWEVEVEYAWLLNPERYDPSITQVFDLDDYDGVKSETLITNFYARDYRSFLLGEEYVFSNGTYFRGRRFFDLNQTFDKVEIVGENYDLKTKTRTPDKVLKTPYLFIRVSEESYNIFISPYVDDDTGEVYEYTEAEFFRVVENMFDFFLFDALRPTNVRVVIIVTGQILEDDAVIDDEITEEWSSTPVEADDTGVYTETEESLLISGVDAGYQFLAGTPPSPYNKDVVLSSIAYRNLVTNSNTDPEYYVDSEGRNYTILDPEIYPVARAGTRSFRFITPHEETFTFRRVVTSEQSKIDPTAISAFSSFPYPDDNEQLSLNVDFITQTFSILEDIGIQEIIVRNPTTITSPMFGPAVDPLNPYYIGNTVIDPVTEEEYYNPNTILSMNFKEGGDTVVHEEQKEYTYVYNAEVHFKESNAQDTWSLYIDQPKETDLNNITEANTIVLLFNEPVPYDFILDVTYLEQPHWENRY